MKGLDKLLKLIGPEKLKALGIGAGITAGVGAGGLGAYGLHKQMKKEDLLEELMEGEGPEEEEDDEERRRQ